MGGRLTSPMERRRRGGRCGPPGLCAYFGLKGEGPAEGAQKSSIQGFAEDNKEAWANIVEGGLEQGRLRVAEFAVCAFHDGAV